MVFWPSSVVYTTASMRVKNAILVTRDKMVAAKDYAWYD